MQQPVLFLILYQQQFGVVHKTKHSLKNKGSAQYNLLIQMRHIFKITSTDFIILLNQPYFKRYI